MAVYSSGFGKLNQVVDLFFEIFKKNASKNIWSNTMIRDLIIQETSLEAHITDVINRFVRTGSVDKRKSPGRPSVSEEVVNNLDDLSRIGKHL